MDRQEEEVGSWVDWYKEQIFPGSESKEETARGLTEALGYRIDPLDYGWYFLDTRALVEGVRIARRLDGPGAEKVNLHGLLRLAEAKRLATDAGSDWTEELSSAQLLEWHPDFEDWDYRDVDGESVEGNDSDPDKYGEEEEDEEAPPPSPPQPESGFGTMRLALAGLVLAA